MRTLSLICLPLVLLITGCNKDSSIGKQSPEINGEGLDGVPITLSQFKGKVVLVDFWATWCGPCVAEIPNSKELHRQYGARPFAILGISRDQSLDELKQFVDREKLPWPIILDARGNISEQWKVDSLPTYVLLNHDGVILERWVGGGYDAEISQAIEKAIKEAENK